MFTLHNPTPLPSLYFSKQRHSTVSPWKWFVLPRRRWWQQTKHRSTGCEGCLFVVCADTCIRSDMLVLAGLPLAPGQSAVYRAARAIRRPRSKGAVSLSLAAVQVEETLHATVPLRLRAAVCGAGSFRRLHEEAGGLRSGPPCRECSHTLREQRCLPADLPYLSWSRILPSFPPSPCEYLPVVGCLLSKRVRP